MTGKMFPNSDVFNEECGCGVVVKISPAPAGYIPAGGEMSHINRMFAAYQELKRQGWKEIIYCPKDGTSFLAIEAGSTGVHECIYDGEWPDGRWWILENGDMSPSMPILWKPKGI